VLGTERSDRCGNAIEPGFLDEAAGSLYEWVAERVDAS